MQKPIDKRGTDVYTAIVDSGGATSSGFIRSVRTGAT